MPAPSSESFFDWNDPGHRMPGVVRKCLLFAAYTDPDIGRVAEGVYNSSPGAMHEEIAEVTTLVAERYLMPEDLVSTAIADKVQYYKNKAKAESWGHGQA